MGGIILLRRPMAFRTDQDYDNDAMQPDLEQDRNLAQAMLMELLPPGEQPRYKRQCVGERPNHKEQEELQECQDNEDQERKDEEEHQDRIDHESHEEALALWAFSEERETDYELYKVQYLNR